MTTTPRASRARLRSDAGPSLIDLSGDRLALESPSHVREAAMRALEDGATHYTTRPGLNPLRAAIAKKLDAENGVRVHPEREVLVTSGAREALFVALHVLLEQSDEAVITGPAPRVYGDITRMAGGTARMVTGDPATGFGIDPELVSRRLTRRARVVVLTSPSTPAGSVADAECLEGLAELAIQRGLVVLSLESLEPFVFEGNQHLSIGALPGMAERTVTINGFDAYGLAGWRVGYAAGPESLLGPMTQLKQAMSICSSAVSQYAALAAITGPRTSLDAARALVGERRERALAALAAESVSVARPAAGYHLLVDGRAVAAGSDALKQALSNVRLRLGAGGALGAPGWLSMALTRPVEELEIAAQRLGAALATAKGGSIGG
jgi:aspartate/methionine/tyrosine aminotransferase